MKSSECFIWMFLKYNIHQRKSQNAKDFQNQESKGQVWITHNHIDQNPPRKIKFSLILLRMSTRCPCLTQLWHHQHIIGSSSQSFVCENCYGGLLFENYIFSQNLSKVLDKVVDEVTKSILIGMHRIRVSSP